MSVELYEFQRTDVDRFINEGHKSGLFAYDMALGKTLTATTLAVELGTKVNLIIAPQITRKGWANAVETQTNGVQKMQWMKNDTKAGRTAIENYLSAKPGWYFITWQLMRTGGLFETHADMVIADEVHEIQNHGASAQNILIKKIDSEYRVGLSGTPAGNKLDGLFGALSWLWPVRYKAYWKWLEKFFVLVGPGFSRVPVREIKRGAVTADIPFFVRRLKEDHYSEMVPEPYRTKEIVVELEPEQRRIYDQFSATSGAWLDEEDESAGFVFAGYSITKAMRLREIALATPRMVLDGDRYTTEIPAGAHSSKLNAIVGQVLPEVDKESLVVYSHSKKFVKFAVKELQRRGYTAREFSGDLKLREKEKLIATLGDEYQIMVATLTSVGTGTDGLQHKCHNLVWASRDVKVKENIQARDRLYRPGQEHRLRSWEIVADNTNDLDNIANTDYDEEALEIMLNANKLMPKGKGENND